MTSPSDGRITSLTTFSGVISTSALFNLVSPGNAAQGVNFGLPYALLATNIAASILPGAVTGTLLTGQGTSSSPKFVPVSGDVVISNSSAIATTTITTHAVSFDKMQQVTGPAVIGNVGTALADLATITGSADQVLRIAPNGTSLGFGAINLTAASLTGVVPVAFGGTNTSTLTEFGVVYGNGSATVGITAAGTTAWPMVGNGTALAPTFQVLSVLGGGLGTTTLLTAGVLYGLGTATVGITAAGATALPLTATGGTAAPTFSVLTVPGGGTGTSTLAVNRVLIGAGTSTIASSNVATTGFALVGNGTSAAPGFAVLGVPGGGTNTTTLTAFGVVYGNGTSTVGITAAGTTAWPMVGNGTSIAPAFAILTVLGGGLGTTVLATAGVIYGNGTTVVGITAAGGTSLPLVAAGGVNPPTFASLTVPGGGIGTTSNTPFAVLLGGTTATSQVQSISTTGASGLVLTSQGSAAQPLWSSSGAGSVISVSGSGLATGTVTTTGSITVAAATQAEMESATSTTVAVTPLRQQFHPSAAKAWVLFVGATGTTLASYNVSSVSRTSTGVYVINFITAMSTTSYGITCNSTGDGLGFPGVVSTSRGTTSAGIAAFQITPTPGTVTDPIGVYFTAFGDQ